MTTGREKPLYKDCEKQLCGASVALALCWALLQGKKRPDKLKGLKGKIIKHDTKLFLWRRNAHNTTKMDLRDDMEKIASALQEHLQSPTATLSHTKRGRQL
jgi:hypothetical protein